MTFETAAAPLDRRWWDAAATQLLGFAARCELPARDLRSLTVLVPRMLDRPWLFAALARALESSSAAVAPRVTTLERWSGSAGESQTRRLAELFEALRGSKWVRRAFGERPSALWALAAELADLGDELTLAAVGDDARFEGRWHESVARHFQRRAAGAASEQSQLVLHLWRAHCSSEFGAAELLKNWERRTASLDGPLAMLAPFGLTSWQRVLLARLGSNQPRPVCAVVGELPVKLAEHRWLATTWPELAEPNVAAEPLAQRMKAAAALNAPPLRIVATRSLEEEAIAAAQQVGQWLREGVQRIALVASDRLTARRVRALLERASILVADQAGWKLSTTSAAAAVMRWLDLVSQDFRVRDLLDWLRSPFALADRAERRATARLLDRLAHSGPLSGPIAGGLRAVERTLARLDDSRQDGDGGGDGDVQAARTTLAQLASEARRLRAATTLEQLAAAFDASLQALGMRDALARDPVGCDVLRELARLRDGVVGTTARVSLAGYRELLAQHFENTNASDPGIESPVVMTSLAGACLRGFDAAVLIGADSEHLPARTEPGVLICAGVRRDLGLATQADLHRAQGLELATLMCSVPRFVATWRERVGDEPRSLAPWFDRLRVMATTARWPDPLTAYEPLRRPVAARPVRRPQPSCAHRLGERLSVAACQSLVDCPYQFYARHLLGLRLRELPDGVPDKRDLGTALHTVLHRLHRDFDNERLCGMTDAQLQHELERITQDVFESELRTRPALIAYRRRVLDLIPGYVAWLRVRQHAGWRLHAGEAGFRVPLRLDLLREIGLTGRVDRIDTRRLPEAVDQGTVDNEAVDQEVIDREVIDYKARTHEAVRVDARDPGEHIQLPLYALALGSERTAASYLSFERTSRGELVRQFPAADPFPRWVRLVERRLCGDLARIAQGAPLAALGAEPTCSHCEMRGLCRKDEWGDDVLE